MRRLGILAFLVLAGAALEARDQIDLVRIEVEGLAEGSRVTAQALLETRSQTLLAVETLDADGLVSFHLFDYVAHALHARQAGPWNIPGDLRPVPTHRPAIHAIDGVSRWYWSARTASRVDERYDLVTAPLLDELLFAPIAAGPWRLSPDPESPLAIRRVTTGSGGSVESSCLLEPNILAAQDRLTTTGAWWIATGSGAHPSGAQLLVGVAVRDGTGSALGFRLYDDGELVAVTGFDVRFDPNRIPVVVFADLTGNGVNEVIVFATDPAARVPIVVYELARSSTESRVLSFSLCGPRMNGPDVREVQAALERSGHGVGVYGLDGWYGPDTRAAVIGFQRARGLPVTGVVDATTRLALGLR